MIIQWNSTFTLNYIGTLTTLEILIGILKECDYMPLANSNSFCIDLDN